MDQWWHRAQCRGTPIDVFMEDTPSNERAANELCQKCPVFGECDANAMEETAVMIRNGDEDIVSGYYAGKPARERVRLLKEQDSA